MRKVGLFGVLLAGAAACVLVAVLLRPWEPRSAGPALETISYPPDALAEYVPADAAGVLSFDLHTLRETPLVRGRLGTPLRRLAARTMQELPWLGVAGLDLWQDVDRVRVVLPAGDAGRPLWMVHGRIDPARFQVGPGRLTPRTEGNKRLYEYADPVVGTAFLAPAGDTLVASPNRARLMTALDYAAEPHSMEAHDPTLRELLAHVDRTRPIWLALSLAALGDMGRPQDRLLSAVIGPVLRRSRTVAGGIVVGEDLRADFTFRAADEAAALQLEKAINDVIDVTKGALLLGVDPDLLPLLTLVGAAEVSREGRDVRLRSQLSAEQLPGS
jgi:hypothetical protein